MSGYEIAAIIAGFFALSVCLFNAAFSVILLKRQESIRAATTMDLENAKADIQKAAATELEIVKSHIQELAKDLSTRKERLLELSNSAQRAAESAAALASQGNGHSRSALISNTAAGLQGIAAFIATAGNPGVHIYLHEEEREQCEELVKCITEFFLTLDFDAGDGEGPDYFKRLQDRSTKIQEQQFVLARKLAKSFDTRRVVASQATLERPTPRLQRPADAAR
jgi:hypothetical protein